MIILEQNDDLGYYQLGEKKIHSKVMALIEGTKLNQFPEWNFNKSTFDKIDWTIEPQVDLRELYRMRALQLREKYDYIRLECSGGGDSATVAYSFILNGIHLDEVVFRYPKTGEKNVTDDPFNTKPENTLSEFKYAAQPLLQWISDHSPRTRIVIHDYSEDMLNSDHDESWVFKTRDYFQPGHPFKHTVDSLDSHKRTLDQGLSVCMLWGIDKPKICIKDKKWYLYFMDIQANSANPDTAGYSNITNEYFFWSPQLPELLAKQAHIIKNWFDIEHNRYLQHLVRWPNYSFNQRTTFEHIIKPLIYPDYDPTTFQTSKPSNSFYNEMDHWFYANFQGTHAYRAWQSGLKFLTDSIDPKYFNYEMGKPVGLVGFISPFYYLGEAAFVDPGKNVHFKF
ncbi:hypothetical protein UFOVP328_144 [uncultured Caudovirales phage]|uniref:Uncharacterized protein n=1 Tax=uncultured Caudovirales phage TaxID=2100421 RepID=A0A6J5LYW4_9CAUD|nr:hypothetical protein UFOVP328_144 [uncultured Caudovirales phage]